MAVTIRLLEVIANVATCVTRDEDRAALLRHAEMIMRGSEEGLKEKLDRKDARERYQIVLHVLSKSEVD